MLVWRRLVSILTHGSDHGEATEQQRASQRCQQQLNRKP